MAAKKTTAKFPAGERPKQLSILAKTVKSAARGGVGTKNNKVEILTAGESARRARVIREKEKAAAGAMKGSARSHQKDLARMSGDTATTKKFQKVTKSGKIVTDKALKTAVKAGKKVEKRTIKSFK
jgi:hypothetical protein